MNARIPGTIQVLNPVAEFRQGGRPLAPRLSGVSGTRVGFRVQWPSFDLFMNRLGELLQRDHGVKQIHTMFTGSDGTAAVKVTIRGRADSVSWAKAYDDLRDRTDWVVSGLAA
jgi:hypothetical protein